MILDHERYIYIYIYITLNSPKSLRLVLLILYLTFSGHKYELYMLINYNNGMFHAFSNLSILKLKPPLHNSCMYTSRMVCAKYIHIVVLA